MIGNGHYENYLQPNAPLAFSHGKYSRIIRSNYWLLSELVCHSDWAERCFLVAELDRAATVLANVISLSLCARPKLLV